MKVDKQLTISIIIPVLNEANLIGKQITHIRNNTTTNGIREIIVIDGGSTDKTVEIAKSHRVKVLPSERGRAKQMNLGASLAKGDVLYFLHADTFPPQGFDHLILNSIHKGSKAGCFRMKFDHTNWFLNFFAWCTRINLIICRGGDQSLFVHKSLFNNIGGFNEAYRIFEDNECIRRIYKHTKFNILPQHVRTSARKYEENGMLKLQYHFGMIHLKNYLGAPPEALYNYYKRNIIS
jgi:rSAM/selenodomain-associated transferase 2